MGVSVVILNIQKGKQGRFYALKDPLLEKVKAESGCISFSIYENFEDGSIATFVENWKTNILDEKLSDRNLLKAYVQELKECCVKDPVLMNNYNGIFKLEMANPLAEVSRGNDNKSENR